jgi:hypothetical protein
MTDKVLISVDDMRKIRPLAKEIPSARIDFCILEAQLNDLQPAMGEKFYFDFLARFDQFLDSKYTVYQELLLGKAYTYNGDNYIYEGLARGLSYFALARFCNNNPINLTAFGITVKSNGTESTPASDIQLRNYIAELKANGIASFSRMRDFLTRNVANYSLYSNGTQQQNTMAVKFFDPDENYNYPENRYR